MMDNIADQTVIEEENYRFSPGSSREQSAVFGKSLRNRASRISHAGWRTNTDRLDPMNILIESDEGRQPDLIPIRYGRMLQSSFAFFRGAAAIMAADLATTPDTGMYVQTCGDCNLMNFGSYSTPERKLVFDITDFDETLPAPWEWDVKRLATSFVIASFNNHISKAAAVDIARECVKSYRMHTAIYAEMDPLHVWYASISVKDVLGLTQDDELRKRLTKRIRKAVNRHLAGEDFPKLIETKEGKTYIKNAPPLIYHYTGANEKEYRELVEQVFESYFKTLGEEKRIVLDQYKFRDIAVKVAGVGNVGTLCGISLRMSANGDPLLLQIKEARASVLEPFAGKGNFRNNGQRVVFGQKLMQAAPDIFLGWTELQNGRHFYVRQLRDIKIKPLVEIYDEKIMFTYAQLCGWALARAHARSGKAAIVSGYLGNSNKFDDAIAQFAVEYAVQNDKDFMALKEAVKKGNIKADFEKEFQVDTIKSHKANSRVEKS